MLSYHAPLHATDQVKFNHQDILVYGPLFSLDGRVKLIEPALPALLTNAAWQVLRYFRPLAGPMDSHQLCKGPVLLRSPRPCADAFVGELHPTHVALYLRLTWQ